MPTTTTSTAACRTIRRRSVHPAWHGLYTRLLPVANKTSQHILGTSTNLLGFCLFIITALHFTDRAENNIVDELASVIALLLTASSILSFASIRTVVVPWEARLERWAEYLFFTSLVGVLGLVLVVMMKFWLR